MACVKHEHVETRVYARTLAEDVEQDGKVLAPAGTDLGDVLIGELVDAGRRRGPGAQRAHL